MIYWDRPTLKSRAKEVLNKTYWMSFVATLIIAIVTGGLSFSSIGKFDWHFTYTYGADAVMNSIFMSILPFFLSVGIASSLVGLAYRIFVSNLAEVGKSRFFTLCRYGTVSLDEMLCGFKNGKYLDNVKTMFFRGLYTFLWSLLLVVPGIVKSYSYAMIPYILAENPNISTVRAFEISKKTTEGEKWEMFVLDLSFIGWYLLGALAFGVGVLFVLPYHEAAKAELYGALRFKAIATGIATKEEIGAEL